MTKKTTNKNMRNAIIRISARNTIHEDNPKLNLKVGDTYEYTKEDILSILDDWCKTKPFYYYMIEHNEDEDNKHFHIVIEFKGNSQCRWNTLKRKFPYGFIDNCRSGVHACVRYLTHIDHPQKYQYNWDDVITNSPGRLERYKQPSRYTEQLFVDKIVEQIVEGKIKEYELADKVEPLLCVKYHTTFDNAFKLRNKIVANNPDRNISVFVLQGESRVGKSLFIKKYAETHSMSLCFSSASNDPWQDYRGQDIFCFDDFNFEKTKIENFMKAIDPFNNTTNQRRFNNNLFVGSIIFIATNIPIVKWYITSDDAHRAALFKRISYVLDFIELDEDENVSYYTINRIVLEKGYSSITDKNDNVIHSYKNWKLEQIDNTVHEFDLKKYIDMKNNDVKNDGFLNSISKL